MKMIYFTMLFQILTINCVQEKSQDFNLTNHMILYADYSEKILYVLDTETFEEYPLLKNLSQSDRFVFFGKDKVLRIQPQGTQAPYFEYNLEDKKEIIRKYKTNYINITGHLVTYKDSLLILGDGNNIYYETPYDEYFDSISFYQGFIYEIACSETGILAILYTDTDDINKSYYERKNLIFYDLINKKTINTTIEPYFICTWSFDGNYLVFQDSTYKKIEFPSQDVTEFQLSDEIPVDFKFLNDSLVIYSEDTRKSPSQLESQIYLYSINDKKIVKQLTKKPTWKALFDFYFLVD